MEQLEQTLIIMKPDAVQRGLLGEIIHRFERKGLKIIGMKMIELEDVMLDEHYVHHKDKPFFDSLKKFMKSAPVLLLVLSGPNAIQSVRLIVGPTKGFEAAPGTIRGDFSIATAANIVHASDSVENAHEEIRRFFKSDELFDYERPDYPYVSGEAGL